MRWDSPELVKVISSSEPPANTGSEVNGMTKKGITLALSELTMCEQYGMKPNFSELSRKTGIDRHTLRKYYENGGKRDKERAPKVSKYEPIRAFIESRMAIGGLPIRGVWFAIEHEMPALAGSLSYKGLVSYIRKNEIGRRQSPELEAHPRYECGPGDQLQVDWKESLSLHTRGGAVISYNVFSATMAYSRYHLYAYSAGKGTDDFVRCLIEVLRRLGGIPREILTDNMAAVVSCTGGGRRKLAPIAQLERDLGCRIRLCRPRTPETKGKVESSNRFVNWLMAYDGLVEDEACLIAKIRLMEADSDAEVNREVGAPPIALFSKERAFLSPMPSGVMLESYVSEKYVTPKVPATMLVRCRGREYSVPRSMIGRKATAVPSEGMVYVFSSDGSLVAEHRIGASRINYSPEHYREALAGKGLDDGQISEMAERSLERLASL